MRATISFDIDIDQVESTMGMLAAQEACNLRAAADLLEDYIGPRTQILGEITEALRLLQETATQLQQYRQMLLSFEKAKFETVTPQPAQQSINSLGDIRDAVQSMQKFDNFLAQATPAEDTEETEVENEASEG